MLDQRIAEEDLRVAQDWLLQAGVDVRMTTDFHGTPSLGIWFTKHARAAYIETNRQFCGVLLRVLGFSCQGEKLYLSRERTLLASTALEASSRYLQLENEIDPQWGEPVHETAEPHRLRFRDAATCFERTWEAQLIYQPVSRDDSYRWPLYVDVVCDDVPLSFYQPGWRRARLRDHVDPVDVVYYFGTRVFGGSGALYNKLTDWLPQFQEQETP